MWRRAWDVLSMIYWPIFIEFVLISRKIFSKIHLNIMHQTISQSDVISTIPVQIEGDKHSWRQTNDIVKLFYDLPIYGNDCFSRRLSFKKLVRSNRCWHVDIEKELFNCLLSFEICVIFRSNFAHTQKGHFFDLLFSKHKEKHIMPIFCALLGHVASG